MTPEEVEKRVNEMWTFEKFPRPKFEIKCPICGSTEVMIRQWSFDYKDSGGAKYRCNVSMKCTVCSCVLPTFGLVIPEELFKQHVTHKYRARIYHWREVKKILEEEGVYEGDSD